MARQCSERKNAAIRARRAIVWTIASILTGLAGLASAHQTLITEVNVIFDSDGTFEIGFLYDMDAMMMGFSPGDMAPEVYAEMAAKTTVTMIRARAPTRLTSTLRNGNSEPAPATSIRIRIGCLFTRGPQRPLLQSLAKQF